MARDRGAGGTTTAERPRLLLVEDAAADAELASHRLRRSRFEVVVTDRLSSALSLLASRSFDCLLLDLGLPDSQGLESLRRIRVERPGLPVVVLTGASDPALERAALREGAQDYLRKDEADQETLRRSISHAIQRQDSDDLLARHAEEDPLTRLANRRRFLNWLDLAITHRRHGGAPGVLFIDLDDFKPVNDRYGHVVGDQVLAEAAQRIACEVRPGDLAARFGGDEFVIGCEGVSGIDDAEALARRIVARLGEPYAVPGLSRAIVIGASVGIALGAAGVEGHELIVAADRACFVAKRRGGNRTVAAELVDGPVLRSSAEARPPAEVSALTLVPMSEPYLTEHPATLVARRLAERFMAAALVLELRDDGSTLRPVAWWHPDASARKDLDTRGGGIRIPADDPFLVHVLASTEPVRNDEAGRPASEAHWEDLIGPSETPRSMTGITLLSPTEVVGVAVIIECGAGDQTVPVELAAAAPELTHLVCADLLRRRVAELGAQARSASYEAQILSALTDAVIATDRDGVVTTWNLAAQRLYGYPADEAIGRPVGDLLHTEYVDPPAETTALLSELDLTGQWRGRVLQRHRDGHRVSVVASVAAVFGPDGARAGMVAMNRELSEDALIRRTIPENQMGRAVLETIGANAAILDSTGRILAVNRAWHRFCLANDGTMTRCGVGVNYLAVCDASAAAGEQAAADVAGAIRSVIAGDANEYQREYDCDSPSKRRTMRMVAVRAADGGIVVSHADISWRNTLEEDVEFHATRDPITALPNRELLTDRLKVALTITSTPLAVFFLDLDHFKEVNDGFGYPAGDEVLRTVGHRLISSQPSTRTVGRFAADGFVVIAPDVTTNDEAIQVARVLLAEVTKPLPLQGRPITLTASVGIAMAMPGGDALEVLRDADAATFPAKARGGGTLSFYSADLQQHAIGALALREDLSRAIDHQEIDLAFQPIVTTSGDVVAFEALARWRHPERGAVPPDDFIPFAERTGLIHSLDTLVVSRALRAVDSLPLATTLFVNVSVHEAVDPSLADRLITAVRHAGVSPERVGVELTETAAMRDPEAVRRNLSSLRAAGIRTHLDDFGTGYSSLAWLADLPLDGVKIDRGFVEKLPGPYAQAVIRAVVEVCTALSLDVIAEGVETEDQRALLTELGCTHFQGYLLGRPVTLAEVTHGHDEC